MSINLHTRHFLKLLDFTPEEIQYLLDLSAKLKESKKNGTEKQHLKGKNIALIFEKASTRTRCALKLLLMTRELMLHTRTNWFSDRTERIDERYCQGAGRHV